MSDHFDLTREAADVSEQQLVHLSESARRKYRALLDRDPWLFSVKICDHGEGYIERFHRPMMYLMSGSWDLLLGVLNHPDRERYSSAVTREIKRELKRMGLNWKNPADYPKIRKIRRVNVRVSRSTGKSTVANDCDLWCGSVDPNQNIGIGSKSDPVVTEQFTGPMAQIVKENPLYRLFYPDRVPPRDINNWIKQDSLWLWGRKPGADGATISGRGINSQWTSRHLSRIRADDIVGTESGQANINDAKTFIANVPGLSRAQYLGGTFELWVGTIYGPNDDHSILIRDPNCLSIIVPIWERGDVATMENILDDGDPNLEEWYDIEQVRSMRSQVLSDPEKGPIWWLQNFELTAHEEGASIFTASAWDKWRWEWETRKVGEDHKGKSLIARYITRWDRDEFGKPVLGKNDEPQRVRIDIGNMTLYVGVDQAISTAATADEWAIGVFAMDSERYGYLLDAEFGRGHELMMPAIARVVNKWERVGAHVRRIGIESNGFQNLTFEIMKLSSEYRNLIPKLFKVPSGNAAKDVRLRNTFAARLRIGQIYTPATPDEKMHGVRTQAMEYRPGPSAKDDRLDAFAIAIAVSEAPASDKFDQEVEEVIWRQNLEWASSALPGGVPAYDFPMETVF